MRLLILTAYKTQTAFLKGGPNQILVWGLENRGIQWQLHQPWKPMPKNFDAVLSWPYALKRHRFVHHCLIFEQQCMRLGIPVINSLQTLRIRHSYYLKQWAKYGIPCAKFQHFHEIDEITLSYPMILRTDGVHRGRNMFLVHSKDEAVAVLKTSQQNSEFPPIDLAIEFVDTRGTDGLYRKWRSHVIGDRVIPRQLALSDQWKVNLFAANSSDQPHREDQQFIIEGERETPLILNAARAVGAEIIALDYAKLPNGAYIFWEGNRNFGLSVDQEMLAQFCQSTGRDLEQVMSANFRIGNAIADLVLETIAHNPQPSRFSTQAV